MLRLDGESWEGKDAHGEDWWWERIDGVEMVWYGDGH